MGNGVIGAHQNNEDVDNQENRNSESVAGSTGRDQAKTKLSAGIMMIAMIVVCIFSMYAFVDQNTISEEENRTLANAPVLSVKTWFNREFVNGLDSFLNDHVLKRSSMIDIASDFENMLKKEQAVQITTSNNDRKDIGSDALIMDDRIIALCISNEDYVTDIIKYSKELYHMMPEGVTKYMMLSPTRIEFETEYCKQYSDSQAELITVIYSQMPKDVTKIDAYSPVALACETQGINKIYFRTDHHWTQYGAAFGANALLLAFNKIPVNPDSFEEVVTGEFLGYLAVMHENEAKNIPPDTYSYYNYGTDIYEDSYGVEGADITEGIHELLVDPGRAGYYTFVERSYQYVVVDGGSKGGGVLMMVNDSYGNALMPWIANQFEKVIMIDPRIFNGGKQKVLELVEEYKVDSFIINLAGLVVGSSFGGEMQRMCE